MSRPDPMTRDEPTADVRDRQAHHELREIAVMLGSKHQMPVIPHHAIRENSYRRGLQGRRKTMLKRLKILSPAKECQFSDAAIQDVMDHSAGSDSRDAWHGDECK